MDDCPSRIGSPLIGRIMCILTYGGHTWHMWINYTLLLLNLSLCGTLLLQHARLRQARTSSIFADNILLDKSVPLAVTSLALVMTFQVVICLLLGCSGISIVWCALLGWFLDRIQEEEEGEGSNNRDNNNNTVGTTVVDSLPITNASALDPSSITIDSTLAQTLQSYFDSPTWKCVLIVAAASNAAVLVYYGITMPSITTDAHACAILLGAVMSRLEMGILNGRGGGCCGGGSSTNRTGGEPSEQYLLHLDSASGEAPA